MSARDDLAAFAGTLLSVKEELVRDDSGPFVLKKI